MVSYVAICDDDAGSRKHLERLFIRESEARLISCHEPVILYTESYGNEISLMATPMKYCLFIIHITEQNRNTVDIAAHLHAVGVLCPIILIVSSSASIDFISNYSSFPNISCIFEPITQKKISHMVDSALAFQSNSPHLIELRDDKSTYYVTAKEILYGAATGCFLDITLSDHRSLRMPGNILDLKILLTHICFLQINRTTIVNMDYIQSVSGRNLFMRDTTCFTCGFFKCKRHLLSVEAYKKHQDLLNQ